MVGSEVLGCLDGVEGMRGLCWWVREFVSPARCGRRGDAILSARGLFGKSSTEEYLPSCIFSPTCRKVSFRV